jgi:ABC-type multidrug transport system permease subunit
LLGDLVFQLPLFAHFFAVCLIILLLSSIFILFGIALSYLVKRESVALLITTFILVFLIFISGFVLPIERMSAGAYTLATYSPGRTALSMFSKVVFYDQTLGMLGTELSIMGLWLTLAFLAALGIKTLKNV